MWRLNLVFVAAAVSLISACQSASLAETEVDPKTRLGNTVRYFRTSWEQLVSGEDMVQINSATDVNDILTATTNVAVVVHGRQSSGDSEFANTLKFSLAAADKTMVIIVVDYSYISITNSYEQLVALVPFIAADLTAFIVLLNGANANMNQNLLHFIGFDLGAHIVGIANRNSNTRARKITALSPAGAGWSASTGLRGNDADFVEVIHTDAVGPRAYGLTEAIGGSALDIFPNGGTRQPGCIASDNECNHRRAYQLFAATVDTSGHLLALRCNSMTQVNNNQCTNTPAVFVGTLTLVKLQRGIYRVNTGSIYPY